MATRSTIALEFADGTVQQIYSHWDGYLDHNGAILRDHYSDPFKLQRLIDGGAISSLAPSIDKPEGHSFDKSVEGYTVFYARDRGEELHVNKFKDFQEYAREHQREEYEYILRQVNGKAQWYVSFYGTDDEYLTIEDAFEFQAAKEAA
jgi:hypothetical protein